MPDLFQELQPAGASANAASGDAVIKEEPTSVDQLRRFAAGGYLFALMDSTDQILVPHMAKQLGPAKAISLFTGTAKEQYWQVAPYLFQMDPDLLDWTVAKLWKEPWGIFALSKSNFEDLRLHFKKFLLAQLPDGKVWFFRYYDPRILKTYLPVCQPWELQKFFGPIRAFAVAGGEEEKPTVLQGQKPGLFGPASPPDPREGVYWKIRPEQHKEFDRAAENSFVGRCIEFLKEKLPDQVGSLPPEILQQGVEDGIVKAKKYGMTWQSSLLTFVTLMFEVGPKFDQHPIISRILTDPRFPPNERTKRLFQHLNESDWRIVRGTSGRSEPHRDRGSALG